MPFVLHAFEPLNFAVACQFERAEIVETRDPALAEHFEKLFRDAAVAIGQVKQIRH